MIDKKENVSLNVLGVCLLLCMDTNPSNKVMIDIEWCLMYGGHVI
jgi:hypothetical protein